MIRALVLAALVCAAQAAAAPPAVVGPPAPQRNATEQEIGPPDVHFKVFAGAGIRGMFSTASYGIDPGIAVGGYLKQWFFAGCADVFVGESRFHLRVYHPRASFCAEGQLGRLRYGGGLSFGVLRLARATD